MKKFVSPLINRPKPVEEKPKETSPKVEEDKPKPEPPKSSTTSTPTVKKPFKSPLLSSLPKKDPITGKQELKKEEEELPSQYFTVMHTKKSNKKHKTYDDGIFVVKQSKYMLLDTSGKTIYQRTESKTIQKWKEGEGYELGGRQLEIVKPISNSDFISGKCFFQSNESSVSSVSTVTKTMVTPFKKPVVSVGEIAVIRDLKPEETPKDAFVLNPGHPEKDKSGKWIYDVYIDPRLSKILRDYQKEGIKFMYECIMGLRDFKGHGCLLADDMGLGKSLQTVALVWTLLKRGPSGSPVLKKVIIVTNSSIVKNWKNEFKRWLGDERCKPLVVSAKTSKVTPADMINEWKNGKSSVLIISYDLCIRNAELLQECRCDLMVCDEGHKLKNKNIKIFGVLRGLTLKKIILSGTPLQNDLLEFFCIVDFINPGLLVNGDQNAFNNLFALPISRSREPNASKEEREIGNERSKALNTLTNLFILRRTREKLTNLLPPRHELIIFCSMSDLQRSLYSHVIKSKYMNKILNEDKSFNNTLSIIQNMKKLLTHPNMVYENVKESMEFSDLDMDQIWNDAHELFPSNYNPIKAGIEFSHKISFLCKLLKECQKIGDRVVVVSNFTTILNQIEVMLQKHDISWSRLDGSTNTSKRQDLIDKFNSKSSDSFVFLLSAKAGGYGINLIGANRLVLFDPDWNPSVDLQAMSRVYREGQTKNVFIYRLVSTGTIEEKIFQRQIVKTALSKTVVDEKKSKSVFTKEMLKELFVYDPESICQTFQSEEKDDYTSKIKMDVVLSKIISTNPELVTFIKRIDDEQVAIDKSMDDDEEDKVGQEDSSSEEEYDFDEPPAKKKKMDDNAAADDDEISQDEK